ASTIPARPVTAAATGADLVVQPEGQGDTGTGYVHVQHLHLDHVPRLDHLAGVLDEVVGHRRDVHQPVLVHTDVHEGAERGHVGDHPFQRHARPQIGDGV